MSRRPRAKPPVAMTLLLLILVVALAQGRPPSCEEYCRTTWYAGQLPPPWDPTCDCVKREASRENSKPVLIGATTFKLDDAGIYFEPAQMRQVNGVTYIDQPFYIVHPADNPHPAPPKEASESTLGANDEKRKVTRKLKTKKNKKKNDSKINNMSVIKNYGYVYEMADSNNSKMKSTVTYKNAEDLNKIEESLTKCLDLYILAMAKQHENNYDLVQLWDKTTFHQLINLSDDDIGPLVEKECIEAKELVKISLDEIIDKHLKKRVGTRSDDNLAKHDIKADVEGIKQFREPAISMESEKKIGNNTDAKSYPKSNSSVHSDRTETTTVISDTQYTPQHALTTFAYNISIPENITLEPQMQVKINGSFSTENHTAEAIPSTLDVSITSDKSVNHPLMPHENSEKNVKDQNLNSYNDSKSSKDPQWIPIQHLRIIIKGDDVDDNTFTKKTLNEINAQNRQKHGELNNEESANNPTESIIDGNEVLSDSLFDIEGKMTDSSSYISNNIAKSGKKTDNLIQESLTESSDTNDGEDGYDKNSVLKGNLYFIFGNEYIPAKFIQKSDDNLHIGIDGSLICAKLILRTDHKSHILSGLCDCINLNNCSSPTNN